MTLYKLFAILGSVGLVLTVIRYFIDRPLSPFILFLQNFVGVFFIFSGFVKAVDPMGTSYKIEEYFVEFGLSFPEPYTLSFSVITIVMEIVAGITLIIGYRKNFTVWLLLLLIIFFTILTGYTSYTGHVTDCGCFGDFLKIKPIQSHLKDIFLLALILILFFRRKYIEPLFPKMLAVPITLVSTIAFTLFCFRNFAWNEPIFDFRPYKTGTYLPDMLKEIPDKVEYAWVYKDKASGEVKEFPDAEFMKMSGQPGFKDKWEFVDRKVAKVLQEGVPAKISAYQIINDNGDDIFEDVIYNPDYQLIVVAYDLDMTCEKGFQKLNALAEGAEKEGILFFALTSSSPEKREAFRHENQTAYPFYEADGTPLKTILRSNPGLLLLKDGKVLGKWHHHHFPAFEELKRDYLK